mgnify:CR=1 FL=1
MLLSVENLELAKRKSTYLFNSVLVKEILIIQNDVVLMQ